MLILDTKIRNIAFQNFILLENHHFGLCAQAVWHKSKPCRSLACKERGDDRHKILSLHSPDGSTRQLPR